MSYNPAYITFDIDPFDEEAAIAGLQQDVSERLSDELSPLVAGGPVITRPPQDVTAADGETATFTVTAIGEGALTYQWQELSGGAWADVPGAVAATLSFTATAAMDGTQCRCIVTDGSSRNTASLPATLTVT